jgi:hypothetical protein
MLRHLQEVVSEVATGVKIGELSGILDSAGWL